MTKQSKQYIIHLCIAHFFFLFFFLGFKMRTVEVELVQQRKRKKDGKVKRANGKHEERREH